MLPEDSSPMRLPGSQAWSFSRLASKEERPCHKHRELLRSTLTLVALADGPRKNVTQARAASQAIADSNSPGAAVLKLRNIPLGIRPNFLTFCGARPKGFNQPADCVAMATPEDRPCAFGPSQQLLNQALRRPPYETAELAESRRKEHEKLLRWQLTVPSARCRRWRSSRRAASGQAHRRT